MIQSLYLRPLTIERRSSLSGCDVPIYDLAGGPLAFTDYEVLRRPQSTATDTRDASSEDQARTQDLLQRVSAKRPPFAGLDFETPRIMGVINVTPDSFSDGGDRFDPDRAVDDGLAMAEEGADLVDVGGESTRPRAAPVPPDEELRRTIPVVRALAAQGVRVSIDSRRARVIAAAIEAGAAVVNDVTALTGDDESLPLVAQADVAVVLMHMQGEPQTMQEAPRYVSAPLDIYDYLSAAVARCQQAGIARDRIAIDPGIGFGKTVPHNLEILDQLALFHGVGCPILLGVSRKSFIGKLSRGEPPKDRLPGSLAAVLAGIQRGVQMVRVHDVAETAQAIRVWQAIASAGEETED